MLPSRLLDVRTGDGSIHPRWLAARDDVWLRELVAELAACDGRQTAVADERILDIVAPLARRHGVGRHVVEAVWLVERRRWKTRVDAPAAPAEIRRVVFELAATRAREEALAMAAQQLGLDEAAIASYLFADRARSRILVATTPPSSAAELAERYNLALTQALLGRATEVVATVRANVRHIVRYAKLLGLMASFDEAPDGATRVTMSGPLALFHETIKYGRALARWFPCVISTPGWSLDARVRVGGESHLLRLDASAPVARAYALPRPTDSRLEAMLELDLRRLTSSWRVVRECAVVRAGTRLFFPDFGLVSERGRVLVEVVGYWTPEYLASKLELLRATELPLVVCADERHVRGELAADPRVILFRRRVPAKALIEACERALTMSPAGPVPESRAGAAPRVPEHYLLVPATASIRAHALRAGARVERWQQDVFEDLTTGNGVRVIPRAPHATYGPQVGLLGRVFYAEANVHRGRVDALFVYRVMSADRAPAVATNLHVARFRRLATTTDEAARVDSVEHLFARR